METKVNTVETTVKEQSEHKTRKLFHKDFTLVVIGQIISLFGNGILRFALPLYILKESGSIVRRYIQEKHAVSLGKIKKKYETKCV